jgi:DNA polymerase III delta subunit
VERIGPTLSRLDTELAKLASAAQADAAGGEVRISRKTVVELVGLGREEQAWLIQDTVLNGSSGDVVRKLHALYEIGRAPSVLLMWALLDLTRKLHEAARRSERGEPRASIAKALKLWGPSANVVPEVAQRVGGHRLGAMLGEMLDHDHRSKTGRMPALSDAPANRSATLRTLECAAVRMVDRLR